MWVWDFCARRKLTWKSWNTMTIMLMMWHWFHRNLNLHLLLLQPDHHDELIPSYFCRSDISITRRSAGSSLRMQEVNLRTKDLTVNWWIDDFQWIWINLDFKLGEVKFQHHGSHQVRQQSTVISAKGCAWKSSWNVQLKVGMDSLNKGNLTNQRVRFLNGYFSQIERTFSIVDVFFPYLPIRLWSKCVLSLSHDSK